MRNLPIVRRLIHAGVCAAFCGAGTFVVSPDHAAEKRTVRKAQAEEDARWLVTEKDSATGTLSGTTLAKTNSRGVLEAIWSHPFSVVAGQVYTFRVPYHCDDAGVDNLLLLRATRTRAEPLRFNYAEDGFAAYTSQSLIQNTAPQNKSTRLFNCRFDTDGTVYLRLALFGNPCQVGLGAPQMLSGNPIKPPVSKPYRYPYTETQALKLVAARAAQTAKIAWFQGRPTLFINNRPEPAVFYKALSAEKASGDYAGFARHGISLGILGIPTGLMQPEDEASPAFWRGKRQYDFRGVDRAVMLALRRNPAMRLVVDIEINPYKAWGREHPAEVVHNAAGARGYAPASYLRDYTDDDGLVDAWRSGKWWYPSWESDKWVADLEDVFAAAARHFKAAPYSGAVVGFFVTGNDDGQFAVHYHDHSEPAQVNFRRYLIKKYKSLAALNAVWHTRYMDWDAVTIPAFPPEEGLETYFAPGAIPDYRDAQLRRTWVVRDRLAKAFKKAIGKPVIALTYSAPYHHAFKDTHWIDGVGMQSDYPLRRSGFPLGFSPLAGDAAGGKILLNELDLRSTTGEGWPTTELYREWVSVPETVKEWRSIHRKVAGVSLANGYGDWYYDMGQYFNAPEILAEIESVNQIRQKLLSTRRSQFRPDVCVIATEDDHSYLLSREAIIPHDEVNFFPGWLELAVSGVPYDRQYLRDVLSTPELQRYKVYVFHQNAFISQSERQMIRKKLFNKNRTIIWVYSSGLISEKGKSVEGLSALTGITARTSERYEHLTLLADLPGVKPFCGGAEQYARIFNAEAMQHFWVEDPAAKPFAVYAENGRAGAARKKFPGWTSVFIGAPQGLSGDLLNVLSREAGAYVAGASGNQINMNGEFLSLHALHTGFYTLTLPSGKSRLKNAQTGKLIGRGKQVTFPIQAQETYWFLFE